MLRIPPSPAASYHQHVEAGNAVEISKGIELTNYGHLSTGPSHGFKESYNGVNMDGAAGRVVNLGVIEGGSNGIKSTDGITLLNAGLLTGHKGAGLKSKGDALVINYGIITGADTLRPKQNDGDGDGLDVDKFAQIYNHGFIQGTGANGRDKGGTPNTSEGIAMGGGEVYNYTRGVILGAHHGVLVDNGDLGPAYAQTLLINEGTICGRNGYGVKLVGDFNDRITNNGVISGANGVALDMGAGDDVLTIRSNAQFNGRVDGGTGTNHVVLDDAKGGTFQGAEQMQHLRVNSGSWTLTGAMGDNRLGRVYSGAALINKSRIAGAMTVDHGATYTGGTVANLGVAGRLMLDPATNSRTRVKQDLRMENGSSLAFNIGRGEAHSTLKVGHHANLNGAALNIQVEHESDDLLTRRLRLVDAGQINGQFVGITSNLKTLTPELVYTSTGVFITFKRRELRAA